MLQRVLVSSRYLVYIVVFGTFVAAVSLMAYQALVVLNAVMDLILNSEISSKTSKQLAVGLIEAVDIFLISIAVYIISLGLYSLFIDDSIPLPRWLEIHNLDDLKSNLVSLVIVVLAVLFLKQALAWEGGYDIAAFGAGIAVIIAVLSYYLKNDR